MGQALRLMRRQREKGATHMAGQGQGDAVVLRVAEPGLDVARDVGDGAVDDGEQQDRVGRREAVEQRLERRPGRLGHRVDPLRERRDEQHGRLVPLGLDKQLDEGGLERARRVAEQRRQVEALDVEALEVVQDGRREVALAEALGAVQDQARAVHARLLKLLQPELLLVRALGPVVRLPLGVLEHAPALGRRQRPVDRSGRPLERVGEQRHEVRRQGRRRRRRRPGRRRDQVLDRDHEVFGLDVDRVGL